jgi:agmatine deiminase
MVVSMPAEWEPHERTWMAWPTAGYMEAGGGVADAWRAWSQVANAIVRFEPVTMVVDPRDLDSATEWLDPKITLLEVPLDDAWMRDIGPTFVWDEQGDVRGVDWIFNGWGRQHWAKWDHDADVAPLVLAAAGVPAIPSSLVNEGGGIHVNGQGVLLATRTVQFDVHRNPGLSTEEVEAELARTLGVSRVIWFQRGLTRDYQDFGTRGHVDIVACFSDSGTVLYHDQRNPEHPDFVVSAEVRQVLEQTEFTLVPVPAPITIRDEHGFTDYSYINHYVCNGAVILCGFDDPHDDLAADIMRNCYPGREVVLVDAREIFARGGGIHCITQQQPRPAP